MHDIDRTLTEIEPEMDEFETDEFESADEFESMDEFEFDGETDLESPFEEFEEMEYAAELLSIQSEEELDQFLGKLVKRAWKGVRKIGGKVLRPLGKVLKGVAKKALPFLAGAAGTFFGGPAGGAIGASLGSALGKALETEFEGMEPEDQEFEMAKRFVRVAGTAAKQAAAAGPNVDPQAAVKAAVIAAARRHVPSLSNAIREPAGGKSTAGAAGAFSGGRSGRWIRRGRRIVLLGV